MNELCLRLKLNITNPIQIRIIKVVAIGSKTTPNQTVDSSELESFTIDPVPRCERIPLPSLEIEVENVYSASVVPASLAADTLTRYHESVTNSLIKYLEVSPLIGEERADQSRLFSDLNDTMKNLMKQPPDCHSLKLRDKQEALTNFKKDDCEGAIGTIDTRMGKRKEEKGVGMNVIDHKCSIHRQYKVPWKEWKRVNEGICNQIKADCYV